MQSLGWLGSTAVGGTRSVVLSGLGTTGPFLVAMLAVAGVVLAIGVVTEAAPTTGVGSRAERADESVPGVGTVYATFDRIGDVLLEADADSFQEVKLVGLPQADTYSLAFVTVDGPGAVSEAAEEEMQVLFVPMAPNPVMGGFLVCVPTEQVLEVGLSVEEAFQAIVTSGVAMSEPEPARAAANRIEA